MSTPPDRVSGDAASFIGNIPEHYDTGLGPVIFVDYAAEIARRTAACGPERVLETAAGTGMTGQLRDVLPPGAHLIATDLNAPMLDVARTKFRSGEAVDFRPADAASLPFSDGAFDAVVCQFGVMFFPQKEAAYREVHRVLAGGGHYLFSVWDSHRHNPFGRIAHEAAASFFPADPPQFYNVPFSYYRIDPIKESLIEIGFNNINIAVVKLYKEIPDVARFARGLIHGNPLIDQIRTRGGVEPDRVVDALTRALRAEFGADPARMPLQAIVFSATKGGRD
jgi:ubiquinone/menaquinone biosynthesis C-methylase UbiE